MNARLTRRSVLAGVSVWSLSRLLPAAGERGFPVLTFNIRYANRGDGPNRWENRRDTVADVIGKNGIVAGLQEVLSGQLDDLMARLPGWDCLSRTREARDGSGEACPIVWHKEALEKLDGGTFWLSESPEKAGSISWESSLPRICTWARFRHRASGLTFHFYNLHLDHKSARAREMGAALVAQRAARPVGPVIVLGDFNAPADSPPLRAFARDAGWTHVAATAGPDGDGTFNGWREQGEFPRIDHVLTRGLTTANPSVLRPRVPGGGWASDHFPVKVTVAL